MVCLTCSAPARGDSPPIHVRFATGDPVRVAQETLPEPQARAGGAGQIQMLGPQTAPAQADDEPAGSDQEPRISNVFVDTDLRQALQDIALDAQVTIATAPEVTGLVTAELENATLDEALEIVLAGTGYLVEETPIYYLVYAPDPDSPVLREVSRTHREKLDFITAAQALQLLPPYLADFASAGETTNVIAVSAPSQILEEALQAINELDRPQRHVMLQSRVVVLEENDLLDLGTQWGFPQFQAGGFINDALSGYGLRLGYTPDRQFTNELVVALDMLQREDRAEILSEPVVMAQDGQVARISVVQQEFFRIVGDGAFFQANIEEIETGTILQITPQIGEGGEITLQLSIEVSDVVARGEDGLPVVSRRTAENVVRLYNGGTAAIGGLMATQSQESRQQVPWFGRIPLVGRIFQYKAESSAQQQVAVFITATIVEGVHPGIGGAHPGVGGVHPGAGGVHPGGECVAPAPRRAVPAPEIIEPSEVIVPGKRAIAPPER